MESTDYGLVTPEMLQGMVSNAVTDTDIPDQTVDNLPPQGQGDDHGDR